MPGRAWFIRRAGQQPRLGSALSRVPPFPKSRKEEGEANRQPRSQGGLVAGFWVSVGFLFDCYLGVRVEPIGIGTAGTPALVRLLSSAWLPPPVSAPARPTVRGCGWGEGERDHLRPEPLPCAGRGSGGSEGKERGETG